jgi:hypothetical protein
MPSWKSFGSWLGSTVAGTVSGLGTTALLTAIAQKVTDDTLEGKVAIALAAAIIGSIAGSTSQLITSVSREDQKEWRASSVLRLLATPAAAAAFAVGGAFLTDLGICQGQQHTNVGECLNTTHPLSNNSLLTTYVTGSVATVLGMVGAFAVKKLADGCSKNKGHEYESLLGHDDSFTISPNRCCP